MEKMKASELLMSKLRAFEGLRTEAYLDAAGVPTIGYGHTGNVRMGDRISKYWADELLKEDVEQVEWAVNTLHVARTQGQFDALVSFAFNVGFGRLKRSKLLQLIRHRANRAAIRREFKRWVYADGRPQKGLQRRREWEANRFFESDEPVRPFDVEW